MDRSKGALVLSLAALVTLGSLGLAIDLLPGEAEMERDLDSSPAPSPTALGDRGASQTKVVELDRDLPSSTGWYLVPVNVTAAADVRVSLETDIHPVAGGHAGFAHILAYADEEGDVRSLGSPGAVVSPDRELAANHGGEQVTCCPVDERSKDPGSARLTRTVRAASGGTVYVGLAASGWGPNSTHTATAEIARSLGDRPAALSPSAHLTGEDVEVFNLADEARRNGTNAQHRDETVAGEHGDAEVSIEATRGGLLFLRQDVSQEASANLTIELPNGTEIVRGPTRDAFGDIHPYRGTISLASGPGRLTVSWHNVSDPGRHDHRDGSGTASAIGIFADLPIPLRGIEEHAPSPLARASGPEDTVIEFGAERLPASTGWFVVPVTVEERARFVFEVRSWMDTDAEGPRAAVPFYQTTGDLLRFQPEWVPATPRAEASHEDEYVSCCSSPSPTPGDDDGEPIARSGRAGVSGTLAPNETLHVGLAAYDWRQSDRLLFRVASSSPSLSVGSPEQGTKVEVADLFHEAYKEGSSVQTYGSPVVGEARQASVDVTADRGGFFAAAWDLDGEARADITLRASDGTVLAPNANDEVAQLAGSTGPGRFEATIADAYRPGPDVGTVADGTDPDAMAMVLFADVAFPQGEIHGFRTPGGPEHR